MFEDKKGTKLHVSRPLTKDVNDNISFEGCKVYHSQVMKLMTNTMPNLCNILLIISAEASSTEGSQQIFSCN